MVAESAPFVLLAGGRSSRMGTPKGLLPFFGRPWIEEQLARFAQFAQFTQAGGANAVVVLGHDADVYRAALPWLQAASGDATRVAAAPWLPVVCVTNPAPERGPFSSILTGLGALDGDARGAWILPIDVPCAEPGTLRAIADALGDDTLAVVPEHAGRGGHPVLLARSFVATLRANPRPDARLDEELRALPRDAVVRVCVQDACVCRNANTPADWEALVAQAQAQATSAAARVR